jgi:hypothetical protein
MTTISPARRDAAIRAVAKAMGFSTEFFPGLMQDHLWIRISPTAPRMMHPRLRMWMEIADAVLAARAPRPKKATRVSERAASLGRKRPRRQCAEAPFQGDPTRL